MLFSPTIAMQIDNPNNICQENSSLQQSEIYKLEKFFDLLKTAMFFQVRFMSQDDFDFKGPQGENYGYKNDTYRRTCQKDSETHNKQLELINAKYNNPLKVADLTSSKFNPITTFANWYAQIANQDFSFKNNLDDTKVKNLERTLSIIRYGIIYMLRQYPYRYAKLESQVESLFKVQEAKVTQAKSIETLIESSLILWSIYSNKEDMYKLIKV